MEQKKIMEMTALEMGRAIKEKEITPTEACEAVLATIKEKDEKIDFYDLPEIPFENIKKELPAIGGQRAARIFLAALFTF